MSSPYLSLYEDRRDANERGESNLTHAVRYAFSSTMCKSVTVLDKVRSRSIILSCLLLSSYESEKYEQHRPFTKRKLYGMRKHISREQLHIIAKGGHS